MAVWALRQLAFSYTEDAWDRYQFEPSLEKVGAPFESNPNLRAQRGLFTLVKYHTPRENTDYRLPTIAAVISRYEEQHPYADGPWLRKMTLPHSEAPKLLRLLDRFNINASTIYPGYDGVVASIKEREFYG
jgi:hypothetical protein